MANRPDRNRNRTTKKKLSQTDINRAKPVGVLTLDLIKEKSARINTINVRLPDGEIYEFYHLPMTVAEARDFFAREDKFESLKETCHQRLVNKDGTPLSDDINVWDDVDVKILDNIVNAMLESQKEEGGED
jgi:hypothetical protein